MIDEFNQNKILKFCEKMINWIKKFKWQIFVVIILVIGTLTALKSIKIERVPPVPPPPDVEDFLFGAAYSYTQYFNTLNTASLNGQDSWTLSGAAAVVTTTAAALFEGAKGVQMTGTSECDLKRAGVDADSGNIYFAMKSTSGTVDFQFSLYITGYAERLGVTWQTGGAIVVSSTAAGSPSETLVASASADTWYYFDIDINQLAVDGTVRARVKPEGGSWTSYSNYIATDMSVVNIINVYISNGQSFTGYFDTIGTTDESGGGGGGAVGINETYIIKEE